MKIGLLLISINPPYWAYAKDLISSARKHFMKMHEVDFLLWTDIPEGTDYGCRIFPLEAMEWPMPTLLRYHIFLQQEEELKKYDYLFFLDIDMLFLTEVGDEILGEGITAVEHPMYALRKEFIYPFEPNPESAAYIDAPKKYFAGGFQGGTSKSFIEAMKSCKRGIDADFNFNYRARWNDESHWNRYLLDHPPSVILDPSYCYPNSLVDTYYKPIWGRDYLPVKITTIDKRFFFTKYEGDELKKKLEGLGNLNELK